MRTLVALAALPLALAATPALAGGGQVRAGFGVGSAFNDTPEDLRVHLQGEFTPLRGGLASLGVVFPFTLSGSSTQGFGYEVNRSTFEFAPSLRVRLLDQGVARPYADAGFGIAATATEVDGLFGRTSSRVGWLSRFVLGLELGMPDKGFFVALEPAMLHVYGNGESASARYGAAFGLGARF